MSQNEPTTENTLANEPFGLIINADLTAFLETLRRADLMKAKATEKLLERLKLQDCPPNSRQS